MVNTYYCLCILNERASYGLSAAQNRSTFEPEIRLTVARQISPSTWVLEIKYMAAFGLTIYGTYPSFF